MGEFGDERAVAAILEWLPLKRDYCEVLGGSTHAASSVRGLDERWRSAASALVEHRFPLEDACIEALRNMGGEEAGNALSRFGVRERYLS